MQSLCNFWRTPQLKIQNQEPSLSIHFSRWFILIPDWSPLGQFIGQLIRSSTDKSVFLNVRLQDHPWSGLSCDVITWFTETCDTCAQINASVTYYCFIDKIACLQIIENQLEAEGLEKSFRVTQGQMVLSMSHRPPPNQLPRVLWDRFKELVPFVGRDMACNRSGASSIIFTIIVSIYAFKSFTGVNDGETSKLLVKNWTIPFVKTR